MPTLRVTKGNKIWDIEFEGNPKLQAVLAEEGFALPLPCGGTGRCGKCTVEIDGNLSTPTSAELRHGKRLSCQITLHGDADVRLPDESPIEQIQTEGFGTQLQGPPMEGRYGGAVDIGTTTLALKLYDLQKGILLTSSALQNPQTAIAADVMGRIQASIQGKGPMLQCQVVEAVDHMLKDACAKSNIRQSEVDTLVVAGNTTMLYLLTGHAPHSLAYAPFRADYLFDTYIRLIEHQAYLPPCINAFVGADIACAVLVSEMCERPETSLLVDMGTNGEIALWKGGRLYVSSTAAGPAFEGVGIEMGCGSVQGAIDRVWLEEDILRVHTISDTPAIGICGSGLIDAVACLLENEQVDETGASACEKHYLTKHVYLTAMDIRNIQLAKAAIAAGIRTLMRVAEIEPCDIKRFYIAGGFGSHLNVQSAARIGLVHEVWLDKTTVLGNAALAGASAILLHQNGVQKVQRIAGIASHVELGGNPDFNTAFIDEMSFPS